MQPACDDVFSTYPCWVCVEQHSAVQAAVLAMQDKLSLTTAASCIHVLVFLPSVATSSACLVWLSNTKKPMTPHETKPKFA